jgi:alkanesulfonate monooxygenase SsuD/methylene tetrahydromethanopterin reductase-like flavin-dependent oxidoreductase (luciferase family)
MLMKIGVAPPYLMPGLNRALFLEWVRRIDEGPFDSLVCGDRVTYENLDLCATLAAAGALTHRVRIMSTVLILPLHASALLAKWAATVDVISGGRLSLGVGVGGLRPHDYQAAERDMTGLHDRLDHQIAEMRRIWAGEAPFEGADPIGPRVVQEGGPPLYASARMPRSMARAATWADGFLSYATERGLDGLAAHYEALLTAWSAAGRRGRPYMIYVARWGLGSAGTANNRAIARRYFAPGGGGGKVVGDRAILAPPSDELEIDSTATIRRAIATAAEIGFDEIDFVPTSADLDDLDGLADIVSGS